MPRDDGNAPLFDLAHPRTTLSLGERIVADIKRALFNGEIKAGSFLGSEKDLVQKYGVGRHSVRDALRSLFALGMVDIKRGARGGAVVAEPNMDRFAEALAIQFKLADVGSAQALQAQSAIEGMAAELAATQRTADDLTRLGDLLKDAETLFDDPVAFSRNGLDFHMAVARASHNDVLEALLSTLRFVIWQREPRALPRVAVKVHGIHTELFNLIEGGKASEAGDLMRRHIYDIRSSHLPQSGDAANCC
jgi:GntR family transcriptional regulator, transcriptional repressor for pyruvate dehydrogenase complex